MFLDPIRPTLEANCVNLPICYVQPNIIHLDKPHIAPRRPQIYLRIGSVISRYTSISYRIDRAKMGQDISDQRTVVCYDSKAKNS